MDGYGNENVGFDGHRKNLVKTVVDVLGRLSVSDSAETGRHAWNVTHLSNDVYTAWASRDEVRQLAILLLEFGDQVVPSLCLSFNRILWVHLLQ